MVSGVVVARDRALLLREAASCSRPKWAGITCWLALEREAEVFTEFPADQAPDSRRLPSV